MKKYLYTLIHEHKHGNSIYNFQSDKLYKELTPKLQDVLIKKLEIDYEEGFEYLTLSYNEPKDIPTI